MIDIDYSDLSLAFDEDTDLKVYNDMYRKPPDFLV